MELRSNFKYETLLAKKSFVRLQKHILNFYLFIIYQYPKLDSISFILVGNKCDLNPILIPQEIDELKNKFNIHYFETSAKDDTNVDEAFTYLGDLAYRPTYLNQDPNTIQNNTIKIEKNNNQNKEKNAVSTLVF